MTTVKMTARGNIKVTDEHGNTSKFYAVPSSSLRAACDCPVRITKRETTSLCPSVHCAPGERPEGYRLAGKSVWFISKERYDKLKPAKEQA